MTDEQDVLAAIESLQTDVRDSAVLIADSLMRIEELLMRLNVAGERDSEVCGGK